jgi:hypothetical protein
MKMRGWLLRGSRLLAGLARGEPTFKDVGHHVEVTSDSVFGDSENISLGSYVYIGPEAYFWGSGGIRVDHVLQPPV